MGDPTKVYCDNEELKKMILCVHPSKEGLFPHELSMLLYVSWGTLTTKNEQKWSGVWKYDYYVDQPQELFKSLLERGFIRECSDDELFDCVKMSDIRNVLKNHGIKAGNKKDQAKLLLEQTVTGSELYNDLGFRYYVLTVEGKKAVNENLGTDMPGYPGWDPGINLKYPALKADQIQKRGKLDENNKNYDINIDSQTLKYKCCYANTSSEINPWRVIQFDDLSEINIYIDNSFVDKVKDINTLQVLYAIQMLVVGRINKTDKTVDCFAYSIKTRSLLFNETVDYGIYLNGPTYEMTQRINTVNQAEDGSTKGSQIVYYFSVHDVLANEIIQKYIAEKSETIQLAPLIPDDKTLNYKVEVDAENVEIQKLIMYMAVDKMIDVPQIMNVPIHFILRAMAFHSDKKIEEAIISEHCRFNPEVCNAVSLIEHNISTDYNVVITALLGCYAPYALCVDPMSYCFDYSQFREIKNNRKDYAQRYSELVLSLRERGIIDARWISEFSLYKLVLSYYDDTEYQKHFDWLGLQSLDIYIPQLKTGIEYQGEQHYMPVEIFGGEAGYKEIVQRDKRKKSLCQLNGVRLIEWPYLLEVTPENLEKMLN